MVVDANTILDILKRVSPSVDWSAIGSSDSLEDAGLDSLDKASFFLELESVTKARISDEVYEDIDTIADVIAICQRSSSGASSE